MHDDEVILKVDIANAYNTISRNACLRGVQKYCPDLLRWATWCLNGSSKVYNGTTTIACTAGVQQGDPLAPLLYSVGLHSAIEELLSIPGLKTLFYLDDGLLYGKADIVLRALGLLQTKLAQIDQCINLGKCEIYSKSPAALPTQSAAVPVIVEHDKWSYLGSPIFEQTDVALQAVLARVQQSTEAITALAGQCPEQAFHLLRATAGACRIEYLLQTLSSSALTETLVTRCSAHLHSALAAILQCETAEEPTWAHATRVGPKPVLAGTAWKGRVRRGTARVFIKALFYCSNCPTGVTDKCRTKSCGVWSRAAIRGLGNREGGGPVHGQGSFCHTSRLGAIERSSKSADATSAPIDS